MFHSEVSQEMKMNCSIDAVRNGVLAVICHGPCCGFGVIQEHMRRYAHGRSWFVIEVAKSRHVQMDDFMRQQQAAAAAAAVRAIASSYRHAANVTKSMPEEHHHRGA